MLNKKAIVLLSGGLDSATVLAIAKSQGYACHCLCFDYGQRHRQELAAARAVANAIGVAEVRTAVIDLAVFGGSALTDPSLSVPKDQVGGPSIPITYVPARNTIFLSFALAYAETRGASDLFLGVNALDYSGYPDCRPEYITAFEKLANLATRAGVESKTPAFRVHTPLIDLKKSEIIRKGMELGVPYQLTHSCYDPVAAPGGRVLACGHCDSCLLRLQGFKEAGGSDPVAYVRRDG